jgi:hypothetical protein
MFGVSGATVNSSNSQYLMLEKITAVCTFSSTSLLPMDVDIYDVKCKSRTTLAPTAAYVNGLN